MKGGVLGEEKSLVVVWHDRDEKNGNCCCVVKNEKKGMFYKLYFSVSADQGKLCYPTLPYLRASLPHVRG